MSQPAPIAVALDAPDLETAARWAGLVTQHVSTVKIGLELYLRYGPGVVASIRGASGVQVFLDLKLHDIPATVAGAARAVAKLRPDLVTVHASGGPEVVRAAVEAAPDTTIAAVTLLTSLSADDLERIGIRGPLPDAVRRLAVLAVEAGAGALVCSPREVAAVRSRGRPGHPAHHAGGPARRGGAARPGPGGHARGGPPGRRGSPGDRPAYHRGPRPRSGRLSHRRAAPAARAGPGMRPPIVPSTPRVDR